MAIPVDRRYAIYFSPPPDDSLWERASRWLGRDAATGKRFPPLALAGMTVDEVEAATEAPRRYGFHATLKPPFRLAPGSTVEEFLGAVESLAATLSPFDTAPMELISIGTFLAIAQRCPAMDILAARCVRELDLFRAPATTAEIAQRRRPTLTVRQENNLALWGYPYVFDEFRFHMTLTGSIVDTAVRDRLQAALTHHFRAALGRTLRVDSVSLFVQADKDAPFEIAERFAFGGR